jgi:dihydroorotate dehydrogenase electron transfer subunit
MNYYPAVEVLRQEELASGCFRITFLSEEIAAAARPGQFLHVRVAPSLDPLLRRPLSVHAVNRQTGEVALLYRVTGRGTELLARKKKGDSLDVLGPLGRGFALPGPGRRAAVVAGGIGVAPLFFLLQRLAGAGNPADVLLGARSSKMLILEKEIRALGFFVRTATDDGSAGYRGAVTDLLAELLAQGGTEMVYACGPVAMLAATARLLEKHGVKGQVSLEERMGCGVGACFSCACRVREGDGRESYRRVCCEGPVFWAGEVVW